MEGNTFYDSPNDFRNYLAHHGIKNQKWGVRHGPPYPLGSGTSARIKKGIKVAAKKGSEVYNKSVKPRAQAIAKKGAAVYDAKMPEGGKKVINAAAKKTKEVYEVNKAMAKNAVSNYKKNYEATHKTLQDEGKIAGLAKPGSKNYNTEKEAAKRKAAAEKLHQEYLKRHGIKEEVTTNPEGFMDGTVLRKQVFTKPESTIKEADEYTLEIGDESTIRISREEYNEENIRKNNERAEKNGYAWRDSRDKFEHYDTDDIKKAQATLAKNSAKIVNEVLGNIADNIISEMQNGYHDTATILKEYNIPNTRDGIKKALYNDAATYIDFGATKFTLSKDKKHSSSGSWQSKVEQDPGYLDFLSRAPNGVMNGEITTNDAMIYGGHFLGKNVSINIDTGEIYIHNKDSFNMDG